MGAGIGRALQHVLAMATSITKAVFISLIVLLCVYLIEVKPLHQVYRYLILVALGTVLTLII